MIAVRRALKKGELEIKSIGIEVDKFSTSELAEIFWVYNRINSYIPESTFCKAIHEKLYKNDSEWFDIMKVLKLKL